MGKFRRLITRNLILVMLPVIVAVSAVFLLFYQLKQQSEYLVYDFRDTASADIYYRSGYRNVTIDIKDIRPAGFEIKDKDKVLGKYYYRYEEGNLEFFLISNGTAKELENGTYKGEKKKVVILKDEATVEYITSRYIDSLDIPQKTFSEIGSPYIYSEIDFPYTGILVVNLVFRGSFIILIALIIYLILGILIPALNFETKGLGRLGKVNEVVRLLDTELDEKILYKWDNIYVTDNYYLAVYISKIDVIRLDEIRYLTKHREMRRRFPFGTEEVFTLTASNVNKMYYEIDFPNEDVIDRVVSHIRGEEDE